MDFILYYICYEIELVLIINLKFHILQILNLNKIYSNTNIFKIRINQLQPYNK